MPASAVQPTGLVHIGLEVAVGPRSEHQRAHESADRGGTCCQV